MNGAKVKQSTVRFMRSLLPATWAERRATLEAARQLDAQHNGDALGLLLDAWGGWQSRGELPPAGPLLDLIAVLAHLLGGVAHELRRRPREARELQRRNDG